MTKASDTNSSTITKIVPEFRGNAMCSRLCFACHNQRIAANQVPSFAAWIPAHDIAQLRHSRRIHKTLRIQNNRILYIAELYSVSYPQHRENAHSMIVIRPNHEPSTKNHVLQSRNASLWQIYDLSHRLFNYASLPARLQWRRSETTTT